MRFAVAEYRFDRLQRPGAKRVFDSPHKVFFRLPHFCMMLTIQNAISEVLNYTYEVVPTAHIFSVCSGSKSDVVLVTSSGL